MYALVRGGDLNSSSLPADEVLHWFAFKARVYLTHKAKPHLCESMAVPSYVREDPMCITCL